MSRNHATNYTQLARENPRSVLMAGLAAREAGVPRAAVAAITTAMTNVTGKGRREAAALLRAAAEEEERKKKARKAKKKPADDPPTDDPPTDDPPTDDDEDAIDDEEEGTSDEEETRLPRFLEPAKKKKKARSLAARISAIEEERIDADMPDMLRRDLAARGLPTHFGALRKLERKAEHAVAIERFRQEGPIIPIEPDEREVLDGMARASGFSNHAAMLRASREAQALAPGLVRPVGSFGASAPVAPPQSAPKAPTARFSGTRTRTLTSGTCTCCGEPIMALTLVLSSTGGMSHIGCGDESGGR